MSALDRAGTLAAGWGVGRHWLCLPGIGRVGVEAVIRRVPAADFLGLVLPETGLGPKEE